MRIRSLPLGVPGLAIVAFAALASPVWAQPSIDVTFGRALAPLSSDVSGDKGSVEPSRQTTAGSIDLEHRLADERLRLFYSLDAGTYNTPGDWRYYLHNAGGTWRSTKAGSTRPTVFVGGSASWRANGASWAAADYRGLAGFANVEWKMRPTAALRAGYRFDARSFPDSADLNQREHGIFGSGLFSFPSRTTLIAEVRTASKSYDGGSGAVAGPMDSTPSTTTSGGGTGANGRSRGMGGAYRMTMDAPSRPASQRGPGELAPARLVSVMGRVAQSLADRTGASVQYTRRVSFGGVPAVIVTTPALFFEDGIYDDPFASNAHTLSGTLKQVFASGAQIEGGATWLRKEYRATPALNLEGGVNVAAGSRGDRIWRAGAAWMLPVFRARTGPIGCDLVVDYWYTDHRSNDAFYNYTSHALGLGVSVSY